MQGWGGAALSLTSAEEHTGSCGKRGDSTFYLECVAVNMIGTFTLLAGKGRNLQKVELLLWQAKTVRTTNRILRVQKAVPDES